MASRNTHRIAIIVLVVCCLVAVALAIIPPPLGGYWMFTRVVPIDDPHDCLRFSKGHILHYYRFSFYMRPSGDYRKIGWNRYECKFVFGPNTNVAIITPGWFRTWVIWQEGTGPRFRCLYRDLRILETPRVLKESEEFISNLESYEVRSSEEARRHPAPTVTPPR